jgi:hypothetical protein
MGCSTDDSDSDVVTPVSGDSDVLADLPFVGGDAGADTTAPDGQNDDMWGVSPEELYDFSAAAPWYSCPLGDFPEGSTTVTAFDQAYQYFGAENMRTVEAEVEFPSEGSYSQVGMVVQLDCPASGICDAWDRSGSIQMLLNADEPSEEWEYLELARHITPYRIPMCQYFDVTPLAHLLKGTQTLTSYIDTWVGPGHSDGEGWNTSVRFVFYPGPDEAADEVINIWGFRSITVGEIELESNVDSQVDSVMVSIPEAATRVEAHLITTGHSFGNTYNCAEFCEMNHEVIVNGVTHTVNPWRYDCASNPVSPQYGTWEYGRNGWCPGAVSVGHRIDITDAVTPGTESELDFDILLSDGTEYDNVSPVDLKPYTLVSLKLYVYE